MEWLTKDFIKEINKFLSSKNSELNYETQYFHRQTQWVELIGDRNITSSKKSSFIRDYIRAFLNKFPPYDDNYNINRNFNPKYFYVYNPNSHYFTDFRITNFNVTMNDELELTWFDKYIKKELGASHASLAPEWRSHGHMLVKCTTTTLTNSKYMVANYDIVNDEKYCAEESDIKYEQNFIGYKAKKIKTLFDSLPNEFISLRGFVRYDHLGKSEAIQFLDNTISLENTDFYKFAVSLMSVFIKGACMAIEGEYRFLVFTPPYVLEKLTLPLTPYDYIYGTFNYSKGELLDNINKCYKNICHRGEHSCNEYK